MENKFIEKFSDLKDKDFADQIPPKSEILKEAVKEVGDYCFELSRLIGLDNLNFSTSYVKSFYKNGLYTIGTKLYAIGRLGVTFRNEALSITRDLFEISVDLFWVWHYYQQDREVAETLCCQFCLNGPAKFIQDFDSILENYSTDPFVKEHYTEEKLKEYLEKAKTRVGCYTLKKHWREVTEKIKKNDTFFSEKVSKAKQIIKKFTKFDVVTLEQNWTILCAYTHWDSQQIQFEDTDAEKLVFDKNLNATLVNVFVLIEFVYDILKISLPAKIKASSLRVIM